MKFVIMANPKKPTAIRAMPIFIPMKMSTSRATMPSKPTVVASTRKPSYSFLFGIVHASFGVFVIRLLAGLEVGKSIKGIRGICISPAVGIGISHLLEAVVILLR